MSVVINQEYYERMCCGECGIIFYIPKARYDESYNNGDGWHCPNGHSRQFKESQVDKLTKRLAERDKEITRLQTDKLTFKVGLENREKDLARLRKQIKKLKAGVKRKQLVTIAWEKFGLLVST